VSDELGLGLVLEVDVSDGLPLVGSTIVVSVVVPVDGAGVVGAVVLVVS
jgi:hypothetical protein